MGFEYFKENFTVFKNIVDRLYNDENFGNDNAFEANKDIVNRIEKLVEPCVKQTEEILVIQQEIRDIIKNIKDKYPELND